MGLTAEQRQRVMAALEAHPRSEEVLRRLEDLQTPEELHQYLLNYNCNDGLGPVRHVIRSALCDKGTALYAYWLFADWLMSPPERRRVNPDEHWDVGGLVGEIEARLLAGSYREGRIAFDPREYLGWNRIDEYRYRKLREAGRPPFPPEMLEPTRGERVEPEWL